MMPPRAGFVVPHFRSRKLLDAARGQSCVWCGVDNGTTVAAHSNLMEHGKGKSIKASDICSAHLCAKCHYELDQGRGMTREERREMTLMAIILTIGRLFDQGKIGVL